MERRREFEDTQNLPITSTETKVRNIIIHTNPKRPSLTITSTETKLEISSYTKTIVEPSLTIFVSQRVEPPPSSWTHSCRHSRACPEGGKEEEEYEKKNWGKRAYQSVGDKRM
jgi:hypothetical protein